MTNLSLDRLLTVYRCSMKQIYTHREDIGFFIRNVGFDTENLFANPSAFFALRTEEKQLFAFFSFHCRKIGGKKPHEGGEALVKFGIAPFYL